MILKLKDGDVEIELYPKIAPNHVKRFETFANEGKYDGVVFHRVIDGFMAQTGDIKFGNSNLPEFNLDLAGTGGSDAHNLQSFAPIPNIEGVTDIDSANGFTIQLGKIDNNGVVTEATTNDILTNPISFFYFQSTSNGTFSNVKGGGQGCSAGPVNLGAV